MFRSWVARQTTTVNSIFHMRLCFRVLGGVTECLSIQEDMHVLCPRLGATWHASILNEAARVFVTRALHCGSSEGCFYFVWQIRRQEAMSCKTGAAVTGEENSVADLTPTSVW